MPSLPDRCKRGGWCDFEVTLAVSDCQKEACRKCGRRVRYNIRDGRMDDEAYRRDHISDFCQPFGPTARVFLETYGIEAARGFAKTLADRHEKTDGKIRAKKFQETVDEVKDDIRQSKKTVIS